MHAGPVPHLPRWDLRRAAVRLAISLLAGLLAWLLQPAGLAWYVRAVVTWDTSALSMIVLSWWIIARADPEETRRRAAANDSGRLVVWFLAIAGSLFSLFAATFVLHKARSFPPGHATLWTGFTVAAIALSWALTHTAYTLRYAHLYYRRSRHLPHGPSGGLKFPEDGCLPCDIDFAYFSFTLGMCFQVSDVSITRGGIRREALLHALLSFVYNTTILALALNLASGLLG